MQPRQETQAEPVQSDRRIRQQTNGQAQAGAAAQLIVNLWFVTTDGMNFTVKPIAFHRQEVTGPQQDLVDGGTGATLSNVSQADVDVEAVTGSNAQGQGMQVLNEVNLSGVVCDALRLAVNDPDIEAALRQGGDAT